VNDMVLIFRAKQTCASTCSDRALLERIRLGSERIINDFNILSHLAKVEAAGSNPVSRS